MSVPEISRDVALGQYSTIDWASFGRTGILSPEDVGVLKAAEDAPLDYSLGDAGTAKAFVASLLKVVARCSDVAARQYALRSQPSHDAPPRPASRSRGAPPPK